MPHVAAYVAPAQRRRQRQPEPPRARAHVLARCHWDGPVPATVVAATVLEREETPWQDIAHDRATWQAMEPARMLRISPAQILPVPHGRHIMEVEELQRNLFQVFRFETSLDCRIRSACPRSKWWLRHHAASLPYLRTALSRGKHKNGHSWNDDSGLLTHPSGTTGPAHRNNGRASARIPNGHVRQNGWNERRRESWYRKRLFEGNPEPTRTRSGKHKC